MTHIDNKSLIGWAIIILLAVFSSSSQSQISGTEKIQKNSEMNATQQVEINELKESFKAQDKLLREMNNNVIILMHDRGLDPIKIKTK